MADIPDDIREAAEGVYEFWMKTADTDIAELIARAILAERGRCAVIAEQYANTYCARISDGLASAIRETAR